MIDYFEWAVKELDNQEKLIDLDRYDHIEIIKNKTKIENTTVPDWKINYKNPPTLPGDENLLSMADGLRDTVGEKIKELLERDRLLEKEYAFGKKALKTIKKTNINLPWLSVQIYLFELEEKITEREFIGKWLNYWLSLYEKLPKSEKQKIRYQAYYDNMDKKEEVMRIKERRKIEDYYDDRLRVNGSRLQGKCPFHEERTGSFFIYTNNNTFHCFGACGSGGDIFDYIMKKYKCDFKEALRILR